MKIIDDMMIIANLNFKR